MIGYLGVPGAMVALPYRGGLSTTTDRPVSFTRTLGGKRKAFVGPRARREWDVSFDLMGSREAAGLVEIARSAREAFWYPADATSGNLLSPQASAFEATPTNAVDAGLTALPDGSVARSVVPTGTVSVGDAHGGREHVPVTPGEPVSVGAWGLGGIRFTGVWTDSMGVTAGSWSTGAFTHSGWKFQQRTVTPPAGAAFLVLWLSAGSQYARPTVSWGAQAIDRPGRGCPKSVAHGLSEALTVISRDDAYGSLDVTITEVG